MTVQSLIDVKVTGPQRLRKAESNKSDRESRNCRLQIARPFRQVAQPWTEVSDDFQEGQRNEATHDSEQCIGKQFGGMSEVIRRNVEQRLTSKKPAHHYRTRNCRENDGSERNSAPRSNHFFDDEKNGGNRSVKSGGKSRCRSHRSQQPQFIAGKFQASAGRGSDPRADLQGWVFGTKRLAAANRQRARHEFPDYGTKGHVAVKYIDGGFGLIHAAAAGSPEKSLHQEAHQQTDSSGHE